MSHHQNNDICTHCYYIGLRVTILRCMVQMQHQSCVGFFVRTWCQIFLYQYVCCLELTLPWWSEDILPLRCFYEVRHWEIWKRHPCWHSHLETVAILIPLGEGFWGDLCSTTSSFATVDPCPWFETKNVMCVPHCIDSCATFCQLAFQEWQ